MRKHLSTDKDLESRVLLLAFSKFLPYSGQGKSKRCIRRRESQRYQTRDIREKSLIPQPTVRSSSKKYADTTVSYAVYILVRPRTLSSWQYSCIKLASRKEARAGLPRGPNPSPQLPSQVPKKIQTLPRAPASRHSIKIHHLPTNIHNARACPSLAR